MAPADAEGISVGSDDGLENRRVNLELPIKRVPREENKESIMFVLQGIKQRSIKIAHIYQQLLCLPYLEE